MIDQQTGIIHDDAICVYQVIEITRTPYDAGRLANKIALGPSTPPEGL